MSTAWKIRVDVGGTFTDCVAVSPDGDWRTAKVLSSGRVRATLNDVRGKGWADRLPCFIGSGVVVDGARVGMVEREGDRARLRLERDVPAGAACELSTGEPAPILAARLVTGAPGDRPLPVCEFRLATTRGTNAFLERGHAPVALITSAGFGDLLRIGDQRRPDIYARQVRKAPPLTELVYGVRGRVGPDGSVVEPLDETAVIEAGRAAKHAGARTIAVSLINSWADASQEHLAATLLRDLGFEEIVCSADTAPRLGLLTRAQAAVIDAALTPIVGAYLHDVAGHLPGSRVSVLTSSGALAAPATFRPIESLLSGPAGGVVGAAAAGRAAGAERVVSFDMGGTSTDVARIEGEPDLVAAHTVGGVRIARPAVAVETVAAGGGSVCGVRDGAPFVGPESAGADPGPACYGRGGPLTVTDVNLLAGRISAESFGMPVDADASRAALRSVLEAMPEPERPAEDDAVAGFIALADEAIAEAIRGVSIRRGYDPASHALVAFGGAGPQHACGVASRLGIDDVLIPTDASVLSAVGLDAAVREETEEREILRPLESCGAELGGIVEELAAAARARLGRDGRILATLRMRCAGQESVTEIPFGVAGEIEASFRDAHERIHGVSPDREIEVVGVRVSVREPGGGGAARGAAPSGRETGVQRVHDGRAWVEARVVDRGRLDEEIAGPALVVEAQTQTWLPAGWVCAADGSGALRLTRRGVAGDAGADRARGFAGRALVIHRLSAIAEQMGDAIERAAVSVNVRDRRDYSCGVFDETGRMVASAAHLPVHLGALGPCVRAVLGAHGPIAEGEAVLTNHPAFGGSHLPDLTVVQPVFVDRERLGYVASRAHHAEVGGRTPGSMPPGARTLSEEGVVIPPTLIARGGLLLGDVVRGLMSDGSVPSRAVGDNIADLAAAVAAGRKAGELIGDLVRTAGAGPVREAMAWVMAHSAGIARESAALVGGLPVTLRDELDDGTPLVVRIDREDDRLMFDFTGSGETHPANLNAPLAVTRSAIAYVLRLLVDRDIALNDGFLDAVRVVAPEGTVLNPRFELDGDACPAVAGGNVETSQRVTDLLLRALGLCAGSCGTMNNTLLGNDRFGVYETICSGAAGGPEAAGADAVQQHMTNTAITDPEALERAYPIRVRRFEIRSGSGGAGRHAGGDGVVREIEALEPITATFLTQQRGDGPAGVNGGLGGAAGSQRVVRTDSSIELLGWADEVELEPGDRIVVETPGGGGWGSA